MSASFDWQEARIPAGLTDSGSPLAFLGARYREVEPVLGRKQWQELIFRLIDGIGEMEGDAPSQSLTAIDEFLQATSSVRTHPPPKRLFISHRQKDVKLAERVACIAQEHGYAYWLDVHDPTLSALTGGSAVRLPAPALAVLIAAIIEMALLNCTHVIALRSVNAKGSDWIPYEFGRVKTRSLWSLQASNWIGKGVAPPEYAYLAPILPNESAIRLWLGGARRSMPCSVQTSADSLDTHDGEE